MQLKTQTYVRQFHFSQLLFKIAADVIYTYLTQADSVFIVDYLGFPCGSAGKESACNVGVLGSMAGLGRSPGEGNGYPLQYSGLEYSMDCIVHGVTKSWTQLSNCHVTCCHNWYWINWRTLTSLTVFCKNLLYQWFHIEVGNICKNQT